MPKSATQFTEGNVYKQIITFVWPIILANTFGMLYNLTNSVIVGNYVSKEALSAVSACNSICNIYNFLFAGIATGAGIVVGNCYGRKDRHQLKRAVDSCMMFAIVGGVILTILSELCIPFMLKITNVQPDIYPIACSYLVVYLLGNASVLTYQVSFFIMRSFGDAKHPLYYLIASCFINLSLGILFVRVWHLSAYATALATIISQLIVDVFCVRLLMRMKDVVEFDLFHMEFDFEMVKRVCSLGIPAGIGNTFIAISAMMVQSHINQFPNEAIAGIGAAEKIANFAQIPLLAFASATTNMVAQCYGAQCYDRAKEILLKSLLLVVVVGIVTCSIVFIFAEPFISLVNKDPMVIHHGVMMTRCMVYSYVFLGVSHTLHGAFRAAGNVTYPMINGILTQCLARYLFVVIGLSLFYDISIIYFSAAVGYGSAGVIAIIYYLFFPWPKKVKLR